MKTKLTAVSSLHFFRLAYRSVLFIVLLVLYIIYRCNNGPAVLDMCDYYGISLDHHKADSDSHAAAEILLRYMEDGVDVGKFKRSF